MQANGLQLFLLAILDLIPGFRINPAKQKQWILLRKYLAVFIRP
jgi:hypothetical protein